MFDTIQKMPDVNGLVLVPRLQIQNANAISSSLTWGFPSITAFMGLLQALERRFFSEDISLEFNAIGIICHEFKPQVHEGFNHTFRLTRNPLEHDGSTAALVEEGRTHLNVSLVLGVYSETAFADAKKWQQIAQSIDAQLEEMHIAGGTVVPRWSATGKTIPRPPAEFYHLPLEDKVWRQLRRRLLPGFSLIGRDPLLTHHWNQLKEDHPQATLLDAWLSASSLIQRAHQTEDEHGIASVEWKADPKSGWIVPMPVGYRALSDLHAPGTVKGARDHEIPFRFVENIYSLGQWVSPHRLKNAVDFLWWCDVDLDNGLYRCRNAYTEPSTLTEEISLDD